MNIEKLNKKHFIETDAYYREGYGVSSKLVNFSNEVFTIEIVLSRKWHKDYNATAQEMAYLWKNNYAELKRALGCKIYIIDARKYKYKQTLVNNDIRPSYDARKAIIFSKGYLN